MSIEAITWALEQADIPSPIPPGMPSAPALTVVLLGLANHASRHGAETYPSVRKLAGYARISERQVQRCLKALVSLGLISHGDQERVAAKIPREDRRPVLYNLSMKRGDIPPPRSSERGDKTTLTGVTGTTERGDAPVTRTVLEPKEEPAALRDATNRIREAARERQQLSPIDRLPTACRRAGLTARFDTLTPPKCAIAEQSIALHGVEALVRAALDRHRPWDPARSAAAWIPLWQAPQPPRPELPPRCGQCDEYGWLPDDEFGRAVRCPCRRATLHTRHTRRQEAMPSAA
ncbi:helix-turn-helix domain-containing protein [Rhodococcus rhodochrous]|uniref:helix-turn-helix domain-containing protein n=1 Tax=Rhodococcus rhodochrous TaxID=1829 RepID=UPI00177E7DEE|nr:helix-turn-helix domain-containing protein [Rhodococcus rhodochrous]